MSDRGFWSRRTVLVAGATGFLGGWLVRGLLARNAKVVAIVPRPKPESQFYLSGLDRRTSVEVGTVYDPEFLQSVLRRHRFDVLFHAAYGADVNRVLEQPLECFRSTVESTWKILDLLRREHPRCIAVISSSDKAYGSQALPYRESSALTPRHPYEVAKASQDLAAQSYGKQYGLPVAVTRCANYFGGFEFNFTRLIASVARSVLAGERPILRGDGRATRDYLYIEDAVDVQLLLAERLAREPSLYGEAFNFSYGERLEVIEVVRRIVRLLGSDFEPVIGNGAQAEIRDMHLSSEKARRRLGWRPRFGFDEGLARTVSWYEKWFEDSREALAGRGVAQRGRAMLAMLYCEAAPELIEAVPLATSML